MKKHIAFLLVLLCELSVTHSAKADSIKIIATVNDELISSQDLQNRVNLFLMTTQIPLNQHTQKMIFNRVLNNLIEEKIKLQAATKDGITISPRDLADAVQNFEKSNKIPTGKLPQILRNNKISPSSFEEQLKSDMAWVKLVQRKMYSNSLVTQKEVETALSEAKKDLTTPKFFISEIYITKKDAKDLNVLVDNLRRDPRFELYAMQFSQSPTAANGGRLGWLNTGRLPLEIENRLKKMHEGEISDPIAYGEGYYIVRLDKRFDPKKEKATLPTEKEIRHFLENQKMEEFSKRYIQDLHKKAVIELRN